MWLLKKMLEACTCKTAVRWDSATHVKTSAPHNKCTALKCANWSMWVGTQLVRPLTNWGRGEELRQCSKPVSSLKGGSRARLPRLTQTLSPTHYCISCISPVWVNPIQQLRSKLFYWGPKCFVFFSPEFLTLCQRAIDWKLRLCDLYCRFHLEVFPPI